MTIHSFRIRFWPTGMLMCFAAFLAAILAFVTMSFRHMPELVSESYYRDGFDLRQIAQRRAASDATGWIVQARYMPGLESEQSLVELTIAKGGGAPCDSLSGTAALYRPSDKALDIATLPLQFVGTGRYFVVLPHGLVHGAWQVVAHLSRGTQQADARVNLFAGN